RQDATRSNPCAVCRQGTKGCSSEDGFHRCRGVDGPVSGFVPMGRSADGSWSFYRREGDPHLARQGPPVRGPHGPFLARAIGSSNRPPTDWNARARDLAEALTDDGRQELAEHLGLPVEALDALPLVGFAAEGPHRDPDTREPIGAAWMFPELDAAGAVVGI